LLSGIITLSISNWSEVDPDYGRFPAWFPVLVITRDAVILVGAIILHYFIGNKMRIKPSWTGKVATVCQMCAIAWVMLQLHFLPLIFVVFVAGIFTLVSGVIYVMEGVRQLQAEGHAHAGAD
jgi:cardiolipin synthase (CMP-forming)